MTSPTESRFDVVGELEKRFKALLFVTKSVHLRPRKIGQSPTKELLSAFTREPSDRIYRETGGSDLSS
jgi:hypothetical protein